jgi:hypothetical protein
MKAIVVQQEELIIMKHFLSQLRYYCLKWQSMVKQEEMIIIKEDLLVAIKAKVVQQREQKGNPTMNCLKRFTSCNGSQWKSRRS